MEIQERRNVEGDSTGQEIRSKFLTFLTTFSDDENLDLPVEERISSARRPYYMQAADMVNENRNTMYINYENLRQFDHLLAELISTEMTVKTVIRQRKEAGGDVQALEEAEDEASKQEFWVAFYNVPELLRIRDLRSDKIAKLTVVTGTVTRASDVKPELFLAAFRCLSCGRTVRDVKQEFKYTEPISCPNSACQNRDGSSQDWQLDLQASKFVDWQRVRVQENSSEIPSGSMPRTMDIVLRNQMVERAKPGDKCIFTGCLVVVPDLNQFNVAGVKAQSMPNPTTDEAVVSNQGVKGLKDLGAARDLTYKLCFVANCVQNAGIGRHSNILLENEDGNIPEELTQEEMEVINKIKNTRGLFKKMISSVAPAVYGHSEIKKGILLMLAGGVHKKTPDKINLRGDINVCIVGDPSTSKSQFLKYVVSGFERGIYTSGKAASAAGLTASVVKDPETGDFNIEAGALMLADNGICCIDEFDKMDTRDQVAIHEAMEQQTISIAKAGIHATFNARASILAAANPVGGRYDKSKTLRANLNMSAPIMSRFDLFFVVLDECDEEADYNIAKHIVGVHQHKDNALKPFFTPDEVRLFLRYSYTFYPEILDETKAVLVDEFRKLRQNDVAAGGKTAYRITVRQLESMIRLSEAIARLHLDKYVKKEYVIELMPTIESIQHNGENSGNIENNDPSNGDKEKEKSEKEKDDEDYVPPLDEKDEEKEEHEIKPKGEKEEEKEQKRKKRKRQTISVEYEKFTKIRDTIVHHLKHNDTGQGIIQSELIDWYIKSKAEEEEEMMGYEETVKEAKVANMVINKLVLDHVLISMGDSTKRRNRPLSVHPNYDTEL